MDQVTNVNNSLSDNAFTSASKNTLGKDDFLELLITKMTHQDPLEPMDDSEFIAELAQFSALEQSYNMNALLEEAINLDYLQMQTINNTMATGLIGKEVQATYNSVYLAENNQPQINFSNDKYAASVTVEITNSQGAVIRTLEQKSVAPGDSSIKWDGRDENGDRLPSGVYSIEIKAVDASGDSFTPSSFIRGVVEGIIYREGAAFLQVNGMEISLANVEAILDNQGSAGQNDTDQDDEPEPEDIASPESDSNGFADTNRMDSGEVQSQDLEGGFGG